ncbi:hypothetical protein ACR75P_08410 [Faecalicoccus pleomorphus]|uniref:hypothetical protein n=1 Tax=Faecalicoccus pleomorphus TaxID=1323 RepID=UPI003DA485DC
MWIRGQKRDCLINANDICIYEIDYDGKKEFEFRNYGFGDDYYILGNYSSKEKALKVLDKIHEALLSDLEMNLDVFQMPQDNEV